MPTALPDSQRNAQSAPDYLQHLCTLNIDSEPGTIRQAGIICTIGPASATPEVLEKLMDAGMNIARLNFSHGSHDYHADSIKAIRTAIDNYSKTIGRNYPCAIALDTKGPEIRTGSLEDGITAEVTLEEGATVKLTTDKHYAEKGTADTLYIDYDNIINIVGPGDKVYVDDGLISLVCTGTEPHTLICKVENGGKIGGKKGINLPGLNVDLPAVSTKDRSDLLFGVEQGVDIVFASFIRSGEAIGEIRHILGEKGKNIKIIAKIENTQGMDNIDDIIQQSDGVMVARGDLGIEIPTEKVFLAQKTMIAKCNRVGKPVICATQMLESMTNKPRPTRAEGTDVANAILDGADCVMLSGESAKGSYPLECVQIMSLLVKEAESVYRTRDIFVDLLDDLANNVEHNQGVAMAAVQASLVSNAKAIVVATYTGETAFRLSKFRPRCPVLAVTRDSQLARQCMLYRALVPVYYGSELGSDLIQDIQNMMNFAVDVAMVDGYVRNGDQVIYVVGSAPDTGIANTMRIATVHRN